MKKTNRLILFLMLILSLFAVSFNSYQPLVDAAIDNYYQDISSTATGVDLKLQLRNLITRTHTVITNYDDCRYPEKIKGKTYVNPDQDPNNPNNLILFWSGVSVPIKWDGGHTWNREHVWPKSHSWFKTSLAGADLHHIRPADPEVNSTHNNNPYGIVSNGKYVFTSPQNGEIKTECKSGEGTFEPCDNRKGDVARIVFYLLTRYQEADSWVVSSSNVATNLDMLLDWNAMDPVDDSEKWRNDAVQGIQGNRNPFIDDANYANLIWNYHGKPNDSYRVNVEYDHNACSVNIIGNKVGTGYKGNISINITMNDGYIFEGLIDKENNKTVCANLQYNINNISKDYSLKVKTSKVGEEPVPGPNPEPPLPNTKNEFKLVNNVNDLKIGDNIIIVGEEKGNYFSLSKTQNKNNRGIVPVLKTGDIITQVEEMEVINLVKGNLDDTFALKVIDGYLYAGSDSANHLKTQQNIDNNASWKIDINGGVTSIIAQGNNSHNNLKYNRSADIFSCYLSGQADVQIFKQISVIENQLSIFQTMKTKTSIIINYGYDDVVEEGQVDSIRKYTMNTAGIRFGTCIDKTMYDTFNKDGTIWGVEVFKGTGDDWNNSNSVKIECIPARVDFDGATVESENGNYYQFALVLNNMSYEDIDTKVTARVFVTIDGITYYMNQTTYSLREVVNVYLQTPDQEAIKNHIGILEHIRDYK